MKRQKRQELIDKAYKEAYAKTMKAKDIESIRADIKRLQSELAERQKKLYRLTTPKEKRNSILENSKIQLDDLVDDIEGFINAK